MTHAFRLRRRLIRLLLIAVRMYIVTKNQPLFRTEFGACLKEVTVSKEISCVLLSCDESAAEEVFLTFFFVSGPAIQLARSPEG